VDTVTPELLKKLRRAGMRWLAYGFESASANVRDGVEKGVTAEKVENAIRWTKEAGIHIIANYIVGLPDDDAETMRQTLDEAYRHNFEYLNLYCAMAYPGSRLYQDALNARLRLPDTWGAYAQLSPDTQPLPTKHLSAAEVLRFRDEAFRAYHSNPRYLQMLEEKFGRPTVVHVKKMLEQPIRRNLYS
jgi:radical SAM superfamily enzyme YgiQ (UPF0313 family)